MPTTYDLTMDVYGPGTHPNARSHWDFLFSAPNGHLGKFHHVQLIDADRLIYQFERSDGEDLDEQLCEGRTVPGNIPLELYRRAEQVIMEEPAPRNGRDRCQDWILNCRIALEVDWVFGWASSRDGCCNSGTEVDSCEYKVTGCGRLLWSPEQQLPYIPPLILQALKSCICHVSVIKEPTRSVAEA